MKRVKKAVSAAFISLLAFGAIPEHNAFAAGSQAYNDAAYQGEMLKIYTQSYNEYINIGDIGIINSDYDEFTREITATEKKIGKVSGASNRSKLNAKYIVPAKKLKERTIYEVSQHRLIKKIEGLVQSGKLSTARSEFAKLGRLKQRAADIKKAGGYASLPAGVYTDLQDEELEVKRKISAGGTKQEAASINKVVNIEGNDWGDAYSNINMELKQVIQGDQAWAMIQEANMFNDPPASDQKYVKAKFKIKVNKLAKGFFDINHARFSAVSSKGVLYNYFVPVSGIEPDLSTEMYAGAVYEGWTYFLVNKTDTPYLVFDHGFDTETWFKIN